MFSTSYKNTVYTILYIATNDEMGRYNNTDSWRNSEPSLRVVELVYGPKMKGETTRNETMVREYVHSTFTKGWSMEEMYRGHLQFKKTMMEENG
jgi:hypothetical protein